MKGFKLPITHRYKTQEAYWSLVPLISILTRTLSLERYDTEIITENPDLVKSAFKLFKEIWNDSSSVPLDKAFPAS
jgi:hypothetical protein